MNQRQQGDSLELMKKIKSASIDMILADLPYNTTRLSWDVIIPFDKLWEQYERIIKPNGAIVLTASQPFTTLLIASNLKMFRYEWIWEKGHSTGFPNCNRFPMKKHENICVFYKKLPTYNPQGIIEINKKSIDGFAVVRPSAGCAGIKPVSDEWLEKRKERDYAGIRKDCKIYKQLLNRSKKPKYATSFIQEGGKLQKQREAGEVYTQKFTNYPTSVLKFKKDSKTFHPTQKPVALFEYLIKTYTNPGETVLDNCAGSGTTGIAAYNCDRKYIMMEKDETFYNQMVERLNKNEEQTKLF
jgi:site-specific DNA-methyltransferase (adenine-specific)